MKHKNIFFHYYKTQAKFDAIQETDLEDTVSFVEENRRLYLSKTQYCTLSLEDRRRLDMIDQLPTKEEVDKIRERINKIETYFKNKDVRFETKIAGEGSVFSNPFTNPSVIVPPIDDSTKNLAGYNEVIIKGYDASAIEVTDTTKCTKSVIGNDVKLTFKLDALKSYDPSTKQANNGLFKINGFDVDVIVPANPYGEASKVKEFNLPTVKEVLDGGEKAPTSRDELDTWFKNEFVLSYRMKKSIKIEREVASLIQINKADNASLSGTTLTLTPSKKVDANDVFSIGHVHFALEGMYPTIRVTSSGERLEDYDSISVSHNYKGDDADIVQVGSMVDRVTNVLRKDATEIPKDIFKYAMNVTRISNGRFNGGTFSGCSGLTSIPSGLFDSCVNVTDFTYTFSGCSGLTTIPSGLFDKNVNVTNFSGTFNGCRGLTSIPSGLFDNCVNVTSFTNGDFSGGIFNNCSGLTDIPSGLFDKNVNVKDFSDAFRGCSSLTDIPSGLFDKNVNVTNFSGTFNGCSGLTSIPSGLFDKNVNVKDFGYTFQYYSGLTSIPNGLFDKNVNVKDFSGTFNGCKGLTTIPSGLFDNCVNVTSFSDAFRGCSSLTDIPSGLFDKNVNVTTFGSTFSGCSGLTSIPSGLFDSCVNVTDFTYTFSGCSGLTTIPSGLFDKNVNVTSFDRTFYDCKGLTTIPSGLFDKNVNVTGFYGTFYDCSGLTCESPYSIAQDGSKVHLYERKNVTSYTYCFYNCRKLTDWNQIPDTWK